MATEQPGRLRPPSTGRTPRPLRRAAYLTAAAGAGHAALFALSYWMLARVPRPSASDTEVVAFYTADDRRALVIAGLYLMPFAAIGYLWFVVALRALARGHGSATVTLSSKIQLGSAILYTGLFLAAAAAYAVVAASVQFTRAPVDPALARFCVPLGDSLLLVLGLRMAAVFVIATVLLLKQARLVPGWFVVSGYAVGAFLLLSIGFNQRFALVFPVWLVALCAFLAMRAHRLPTRS